MVNMHADPNTFVHEGELSSKIMSKMNSPYVGDVIDEENNYEDTGFTA